MVKRRLYTASIIKKEDDFQMQSAPNINCHSEETYAAERCQHAGKNVILQAPSC